MYWDNNFLLIIYPNDGLEPNINLVKLSYEDHVEKHLRVDT